VAPPLILTRAQVDEILTVLERAIIRLEQEKGIMT
jgi:adenosylmethionine-8-amino-7-oxononanoate aminotransferase